MIRQLGISILTLVNIVTFIGIAYYFFPGYPHVFVSGGDTISSQPTAGFLCIILFLFVFFTMVQVTPRPAEKQSGTCWACGMAGTKMQWWMADERSATNQRVSYLIHPCCVALAEKQAGL